MDGFIGFLIVLGVILVAKSIYNATQLERAKAKYEDALADLGGDTDNIELRKAALDAGREYADIARQQAGQKGRAVFDEVGLSNDLAVRSPRSKPSSDGQTSSTGMKTCPDCAEEVKLAARKCRFCGFEFA